MSISSFLRYPVGNFYDWYHKLDFSTQCKQLSAFQSTFVIQGSLHIFPILTFVPSTHGFSSFCVCLCVLGNFLDKFWVLFVKNVSLSLDDMALPSPSLSPFFVCNMIKSFTVPTSDRCSSLRVRFRLNWLSLLSGTNLIHRFNNVVTQRAQLRLLSTLVVRVAVDV